MSIGHHENPHLVVEWHRDRQAQRRRVQRLDDRARADVERRRSARLRWRESGDSDDRREAIAVELMTVYRTDADPRCTDLSLDPSDADLVCRSLRTDALTRLTSDADHYGFPERQGREPAVATIADWIDEQ